MIFYAWTSCALYRKFSVLEFINVIKTKNTQLELAIKNEIFFEVIKSTQIPKVKIDEPLIILMNKTLGAFDLKECFKGKKKPARITDRY